MPENYDWKIRKEGNKAVAWVKEMGKEIGVEVNPVLFQGCPAQEILDFAEKNNIDMILTGKQGKA